MDDVRLDCVPDDMSAVWAPGLTEDIDQRSRGSRAVGVDTQDSAAVVRTILLGGGVGWLKALPALPPSPPGAANLTLNSSISTKHDV